VVNFPQRHWGAGFCQRLAIDFHADLLFPETQLQEILDGTPQNREKILGRWG